MSQTASAMLSIFAMLVPQLSIEIAEFRVQLATSWNEDADKLKEGLSAISRYSCIAIVVAVLVNVGTAAAVALTTQHLDERMLAIITGLSRLLAAVYSFFISVKVPKWLGVYHTTKSLHGSQVGRCLRELKFNLVWNLWGHFTEVYFFLIMFYNGVTAATIPLSAVIGIAIGFAISCGIYLGRTRFKEHKVKIAAVMSTILSILSSLATASGCIWIQTVWGRDMTQNEIILGVVAFVLWFLVQLGVHYLQWKISQRVQALKRHISEKYKTILFEPGDALVKRLRGSRGKVDGEEDLEFDPTDETGGRKSQSASSNALQEEKRVADDAVEGPQDAEINLDKRKDNEEEEEEESPTLADDIDAGLAVAETVTGIVEAFGPSNEGGTLPLEEMGLDLPKGQDEDPPSLCSLFLGKICGCCCSCCACSSCCNQGQSTEVGFSPLSSLDSFVKFVKWILWTVVSVFFLFLTTVNIGATSQVDAVNANLPITEAALYTNMDAGPVCAFNNLGSNSTISTFSSLAEANQAGFSVLHCGACGHCSTWDNLRIEYTTRHNLAAMAKACGQLTLFAGFEAAMQCQMNTIGFDRNCSECWVNDEVCARDNCAFVFLQSLLINNVGNFIVAPETITSATCEEAMCERVFVPCSGASRRRMNLVSSIAREESQQCSIVQVNYTQLFG